ncbi:hypothetical protein Ddc_20327 [Ditylenchus destructor]|nr:hypothetical protein Ddc_20327 [Ditylenchus destructor]
MDAMSRNRMMCSQGCPCRRSPVNPQESRREPRAWRPSTPASSPGGRGHRESHRAPAPNRRPRNRPPGRFGGGCSKKQRPRGRKTATSSEIVPGRFAAWPDCAPGGHIIHRSLLASQAPRPEPQSLGKEITPVSPPKCGGPMGELIRGGQSPAETDQGHCAHRQRAAARRAESARHIRHHARHIQRYMTLPRRFGDAPRLQATPPLRWRGPAPSDTDRSPGVSPRPPHDPPRPSPTSSSKA